MNRFLDQLLHFCIAIDVPDWALEYVVFQVFDEMQHPVWYFSCKLNVHEINYSTFEKEHCSSVIFGIAVRQFLVYVNSNPVTVYSDQHPLQFISTEGRRKDNIHLLVLTTSTF